MDKEAVDTVVAALRQAAEQFGEPAFVATVNYTWASALVALVTTSIPTILSPEGRVVLDLLGH